MANTEMILNESQMKELPKIIKNINSSGGFITASITHNILRATSPKAKDIKILKVEISKID